jgi:glutamate 5-kinase
MTRTEVIAQARRLVVKIGSSSLTSGDARLDPARLGRLVETLAAVRHAGRDVVVVSSGAIAAGIGPLGLTSRPRDLARQQAAASVGQGLLVHHYTEAFAGHGIRVGQVLLTVDDLTRRGHYRNAYSTFAKLLELGVVPIVNENDTVATNEIRFGDNDRLSALVAHLVHADLLVLLSDVDAVYDRPPRTIGALRIPVVRRPADLQGVRLGAGSALGTGGISTKLEAARIATDASIPALVGSAERLSQLLGGSDEGTWFEPTGRRQPTRLLWLAHATEAKGRLCLDAGAVRAVRERRASLLPAGVTGVDGDFAIGDPVDLVDADGRVVGRGLVSYDASEIPALLGRSTRDLAADLGGAYERELVHRDALVLID